MVLFPWKYQEQDGVGVFLLDCSAHVCASDYLPCLYYGAAWKGATLCKHRGRAATHLRRAYSPKRRVTGRSERSLGATARQSILHPGRRGWKGWTTFLQLLRAGLSITEISKRAGNPKHLGIMSHISRYHKLGIKILLFLTNK